MKVFKALVLFGILAMAVPAWANSITYSYLTSVDIVPPDGGPGAGILYTLVIDDVSGEATFTISGSSTATDVWRADWFLFKFDSLSPHITALVEPAIVGDWSIVDADTNQTVKVLGGNSALLNGNSGFEGFYLTSIEGTGGALSDISPGVCLTAGTGSLACPAASLVSVTPVTFEFTVALPAGWSNLESYNEIEFQVGYYDGVSGQSTNIKKNILSRDLDEVVPDGGTTLSLLGGALLGLGLLRRKFNV